MNWHLFKSYFTHLFKANKLTAKNAPTEFIKELVDDVFRNENRYYYFDSIDQHRQKLLNSKKNITVNDLGAGSKIFKNSARSIKKIIKYNSTPSAQGETISKLITYFKPRHILEMGTSIGIGTLYLALPNSQTKITTIEGCPNISRIAKENFATIKAKNIEVINQSFTDALSSFVSKKKYDMVYFDGNHTYDATITYFSLCVDSAKGEAIYIFDDIHWSKGMEKAWNEIITHPKVTVSFDLFRYGIVIINKKHPKYHFVF